MSLRHVFCFCAAVILLGATSVVAANAPELLNYQGVLKSGGTAVTTPVNVTFTIYDAESGGNTVWTQDLLVSPDASGAFNALLGQTVGLGDSVFTGADRWLGVQVESDPEMTPRARLVTAPYSFRVSTIDGASGGELTGNVDADGFSINGVPLSTSSDSYWSQSGGDIYYNTGNVGIGTTSPSEKLQVSGNIKAYGDVLLQGTIAGPEDTLKPSIVIRDIYGDTNVQIQGGDVPMLQLRRSGAGPRTEITGDGMFLIDDATGDTAILWPDGFQLTAGGGGVSRDTTLLMLEGLEFWYPDYARTSYGPDGIFYTTYDYQGERTSWIFHEGLKMVYSNDGGISFDSTLLERGGLSFTQGDAERVFDTTGICFVDAGDTTVAIIDAGNPQIILIDPVSRDTTILGIFDITFRTADGSQYFQAGRDGLAIFDVTAKTELLPGNVILFDAATEDSLGVTPQGMDVNHKVGQTWRKPVQIFTDDDSTLVGYMWFERTSGELVSSFRQIGKENSCMLEMSYFNPTTGIFESGVDFSLAEDGVELHLIGGIDTNIAITNINGPRIKMFGPAPEPYLPGPVIDAYVDPASGPYLRMTDEYDTDSCRVSPESVELFDLGGAGHCAITASDLTYRDASGNKTIELNNPQSQFRIFEDDIWRSQLISDGLTLRNSSSEKTIELTGPGGQLRIYEGEVWKLQLDGDGIIFDSSGTNAFEINADGGTKVFSSWNESTGVILSKGSGSWADLSDRNMKANIIPVSAAEVLAKVAVVPISTWNYKAQDESIRHMGPMAQDLYAAFGLGIDDKHINTIDADGVALAAIQGLYQENVDLKKRVEQLEELVKQMLEDKE